MINVLEQIEEFRKDSETKIKELNLGKEAEEKLLTALLESAEKAKSHAIKFARPELFYEKTSDFKKEHYYNDLPTLNPANFIHFTFHKSESYISGDDYLVIDGDRLKIVGFSDESFFKTYNPEDVLLAAIIKE